MNFSFKIIKTKYMILTPLSSIVGRKGENWDEINKYLSGVLNWVDPPFFMVLKMNKGG